MIDCGKYSSFDADIFYELPEDLEAFPPLAIPCKLYGLEWKRSNKELVEKCLAGSDLLNEKKFTIKFINNWEQGAFVSVMDGEVDISQSLVTKGLAMAMFKEDEAMITAGYTLTTLNNDPLLVTLSHFESINMFYVTLVKELKNLDILSAKLQDTFEAMDEEEGQVTEPCWGKACVCKFNEDGVWYRGVITSVDKEVVTVYFVDFGNEEETTIDQLKEYPKDILNSNNFESDCFNFPAFAVCCSLCDTTSVEGKEQKIEEFLKELVGKYLTLEICERGSPYIVLLSMNGMEVSETMCKKELVNLNKPTVNYTEGSRSLSEYRYSVVSHFESLSCIFLVPNSYEYEAFQKKLQTVYNQIKLGEFELDNVAKGVPCVVKSAIDNCWYRGIITDVKMETVTVFFIDLGITDEKSSKELKKLKVSFSWQLPFSLKCSLSHALACAEFNLKLFSESDNVEAVRKEVIGKMVEVEFMSSEPIPAVKLLVARDMSETNQDYNQITDLIEEVLKSKFLLSLKEMEQEKEQRYSPLTTPHLQKYQPLDIPLHTKLEVKVSYVNTPSEFWVQLVYQQEQLHNIMDEIADIYSNIFEDEFVITEPQPGTPCVSIFSEDGGWYRGYVKEVMGGSVKIHFVDYGNSEEVPLTFVREISSDLLKTPQLAVKCSLHDVKPNSDSEWNIDQCEVFQEIVNEEKVFLAEFCSSIDNTYQVKLLDMGIDVGKTFLSKCIASSSSVQEEKSDIVKLTHILLQEPVHEAECISPNKVKSNEILSFNQMENGTTSLFSKENDSFILKEMENESFSVVSNRNVSFSITDNEEESFSVTNNTDSSNFMGIGNEQFSIIQKEDSFYDVNQEFESCNIMDKDEDSSSVINEEKPNSDMNKQYRSDSDMYQYDPTNVIMKNEICNIVKEDTGEPSDFGNESENSVSICTPEEDILEKNINPEDFASLGEPNPLSQQGGNQQDQFVPAVISMKKLDEETTARTAYEIEPNLVSVQSKEILEDCTLLGESFKNEFVLSNKDMTEVNQRFLSNVDRNLSDHDKITESSDDYLEYKSNIEAKSGEELEYCTHEEKLSPWEGENVPASTKLDETMPHEQVSFCNRISKEDKDVENECEQELSTNRGQQSEQLIIACTEKALTSNDQEEQPLLKKESAKEIVCSEHTTLDGEESDKEIVYSEHTTLEGEESDKEIVYSEHTTLEGEESDKKIVYSEHTTLEGKEIDKENVYSEHTTLEGKESDKEIICSEHTTLEGKESDKEIICSEHTTLEEKELDKEIVCSEHITLEEKELDKEIVCSEHITLEGEVSDKEIVCSEHTTLEEEKSDKEIYSEHTTLEGEESDKEIVYNEHTTPEGKVSDKEIVCSEHITLEGKDLDNLKDIARGDNPEDDDDDLGTTTNKPSEISTPDSHGKTSFSTGAEE